MLPCAFASFYQQRFSSRPCVTTWFGSFFSRSRRTSEFFSILTLSSLDSFIHVFFFLLFFFFFFLKLHYEVYVHGSKTCRGKRRSAAGKQWQCTRARTGTPLRNVKKGEHRRVRDGADIFFFVLFSPYFFLVCFCSVSPFHNRALSKTKGLRTLMCLPDGRFDRVPLDVAFSATFVVSLHARSMSVAPRKKKKRNDFTCLCSSLTTSLIAAYRTIMLPCNILRTMVSNTTNTYEYMMDCRSTHFKEAEWRRHRALPLHRGQSHHRHCHHHCHHHRTP